MFFLIFKILALWNTIIVTTSHLPLWKVTCWKDLQQIACNSLDSVQDGYSSSLDLGISISRATGLNKADKGNIVQMTTCHILVPSVVRANHFPSGLPWTRTISSWSPCFRARSILLPLQSVRAFPFWMTSRAPVNYKTQTYTRTLLAKIFPVSWKCLLF